MSIVARHNTEAQIDALERLCDRVAGFGADVSLEWVDGYLAALVAGRRPVKADEWLPKIFGDAFDRAFGDPQDVEQALATLIDRWNALASQLDPQSLLDDPEALRFSPLMVTHDDASRAEIVAAGHLDETQALDIVQTGANWAEGFGRAIADFPEDWPEPDTETEEGRWYDECLMRVFALLLPQDALAEHLAAEYPGETIERDQLVDEACYAVQDLRVYWLDHAPRPAPRTVEAKPGRNDPCPCGSGRKYKKCHGG